VSLLHPYEIPHDKRPLDSHVPAPLAPEVISQAIDLPMPPPPVVIEANNINVENVTGTKSVESKVPKWLKFVQSGCDMQAIYRKFATWLILLSQKNKLPGALDLEKIIIQYCLSEYKLS